MKIVKPHRQHLSRSPAHAEHARPGEAALRSAAEQINMPEDSLRALNHVDWLNDFARMLDMHTRVERTPTRVGTINRLRLAAGYIHLLQRDVIKLQEQLTRQTADIKLLQTDLDMYQREGRD